MKRFVLLCISAFGVAPAVGGIIDAWFYVLFGVQVTGIDWTEGRAVTAFLFGSLSLLLASIGLAAESVMHFETRRPGYNPPPTYARPPAPPSPPPRQP